MIQIVGLFLIGMIVLAIASRIRRPGTGGLAAKGKCPKCGRHKIGRGPCDCGKRG